VAEGWVTVSTGHFGGTTKIAESSLSQSHRFRLGWSLSGACLWRDGPEIMLPIFDRVARHRFMGGDALN
jgi:hypothetical protein